MKIFYGVPTHDRRVDVDCMLAIMRSVMRYGGETYFHMGVSEPHLARNLIAHQFLKSNCDWFMKIDSDIVYSEADWNYLWEGDEMIVTAPYARKVPGRPPADFGLGFTRIHRSVFAAIDELQKEDGSPFVEQFYMESEMISHYYPGGVTGDSRWLGEDRGFFTLCAMTQTPYRLETRCHLEHVGPFKFGYPDQSNGATFWKPWPKVNQDTGDAIDGDHEHRNIVVM